MRDCSLCYPSKLITVCQNRRLIRTKLPASWFILRLCSGSGGEAGSAREPGHGWSQTAEQFPRGVRLSVDRSEMGCQHESPPRWILTRQPQVLPVAIVSVYKRRLFSASVRQIHSLSFQPSVSDKKQIHAGSSKTQRKQAANNYPVSNNLAPIMGDRSECAQRETSLQGHFRGLEVKISRCSALLCATMVTDTA